MMKQVTNVIQPDQASTWMGAFSDLQQKYNAVRDERDQQKVQISRLQSQIELLQQRQEWTDRFTQQNTDLLLQNRELEVKQSLLASSQSPPHRPHIHFPFASPGAVTRDGPPAKN